MSADPIDNLSNRELSRAVALEVAEWTELPTEYRTLWLCDKGQPQCSTLQLLSLDALMPLAEKWRLRDGYFVRRVRLIDCGANWRASLIETWTTPSAPVHETVAATPARALACALLKAARAQKEGV